MGEADQALIVPLIESVQGGRNAAALAAVYIIWGSTYLAIRFAVEAGHRGIRPVVGAEVSLVMMGMTKAIPSPHRNFAILSLLLPAAASLSLVVP